MISLATVAAVGQTGSSAPSDSKPADAKSAPRKADRAAAYYHYSVAHMYEEQVTVYGRSDLANKAIEEYRLAIEADPSSEFLTSGLAELYVKTGRIRDAVLEAQDILKRDPNNLEAHKLLGRIYLRSLGDMPGGNGSDNVLKLAIEQYEQIVKIEPDSVDDHLLLGRLYRLNSDMQKGENELKIAVKLDPSSEEAVTTLAMLYTDEGDTAHALQVLSSVPDSARSAKLYAALGAAYEQRKDYKSAIDAFRHAIVLDRDNLDAIRGLAENLMNDGQTDAALEQYKVIADANPEDAQTYVRIAEIYRRQGKYDLALENLKKADTLVPGHAMDVPYSMAAVYQAQGRYDDAVKLLQELLKRTEKSETGSSQADRNNRAIFIERLGTVYREQENYTAAVETFRKMLPLGEENTRQGYQEIIDTYREAKQWPQATAAAKEAVQKLPNDRDLRMVLDAQLADTGETDKALADVRAMLKGGPEDREVYLRLGIMYTRVKQWKEAEEALNKAEGLSGKVEDKAQVWFLLGDTYQRPKDVRSGGRRVPESAGLRVARRSAECGHAQLPRLHERRSRRKAGRVAQLHQAGDIIRAEQQRLSRFAGLGLLQARKVRSGGREFDQGVDSHGYGRHRTGTSRRPVPENRPPEASRRPLGSRRAGVEQNRPGGTGQRSLRQGSAETRRRESKAGERRIRQAVVEGLSPRPSRILRDLRG